MEDKIVFQAFWDFNTEEMVWAMSTIGVNGLPKDLMSLSFNPETGFFDFNGQVVDKETGVKILRGLVISFNEELVVVPSGVMQKGMIETIKKINKGN